MAQRDLIELSADECVARLLTAKVGRLVYVDDDGPAAVPVNYALWGDEIVLRVEGGTKQAAMAQEQLGFEVDHIDEDEKSGWSVLIRSTGQEVAIEAIAESMRHKSGPPPLPWAIGIHNVWLRLTPNKITGRRLGDPQTAVVS
jgi:uncharacterized protein